MPRCSLGNQIFIFTNYALLPSFPKKSFLAYNFANTVIPPSSFLRNILLSSESVCAELYEPDKVPSFSRKPICMSGSRNLQTHIFGIKVIGGGILKFDTRSQTIN